VRRIARSDVAEVWEAYDAVLARRVALKVLTEGSMADREHQERMHRAAVAAARLSHPNIVATFDTGYDAGAAYFVTELVDGPTLAEVLARQGPLRPSLGATICANVADALAAAHRVGILHGDVRSENIFVSEGFGRAPTVKVTDFGLGPATAAAALYQAPEVLGGAEPDQRSEVFSIGVVLYEVLVGRPPFEAVPATAPASSRTPSELQRPRQLRAGIPRALEAVALKALATDPADRFATAADMRIALLAIDLQADDAVPASGTDPTPPAGMPATVVRARRRWIAPTFALIVVTGALVLLGLVFARSDLAKDLLRAGDKSPGAEPTLPAPRSIQAITSFDPDGDGTENDGRLPQAIDGDPATSWATSRYNSRSFGNLKPGVGIWVDLGTKAKVSSVTIASPSVGWSANVHVAGQPGSTLAAWGPPAASVTEAGGTAEVRLAGVEGQFVLIWFTRAGTDNRVEITELTVA